MSQISDRIAQAISDPGSIVPREGDETVTRWATRAVLTVLVTDRYLDDDGPLNPVALIALLLFMLAVGLVLGWVFL